MTEGSDPVGSGSVWRYASVVAGLSRSLRSGFSRTDRCFSPRAALESGAALFLVSNESCFQSIPAELRAHGTAGEQNPPPNADRHQDSEQYLVNRANNVIGPGDSRLVKKQEKCAPGNGKGCQPKGRSSCPLPEPQKSNRRDDPNHAEQQCRSVHNRHHRRVPKFTDPGSAPKREPGHAENRQRTDQLEHRHSDDRRGRSLRSNPLCGWRSVRFVRIGVRKRHRLTLSHNGIPSLSSGVALKCRPLINPAIRGG